VFLARPLRVELTGEVYHVIARGNERKAIFRDDEDRKIYLERLAEIPVPGARLLLLEQPGASGRGSEGMGTGR
jgi:hypothetical protein